jgi:ubiquinone/menaquinone biosynthesis C-methylase UbiE
MGKGWQSHLLPEKIPELFVDLYDAFAQQAFHTYYKQTAREMIAHCPDGRILDMGCGPGYLCVQMAGLGDSVFIEGMDLSPKMIKIAKENARKAGLDSRLRFFVCDGNALSVKEESYDMVISTGVFHSLKDPVRFINECYRILRRGSEAWIYDPARIMASKESVMRQVRKKVPKMILYLGLSFIVKIFKPRLSTWDEVARIIEKSRFKSYNITVKDDLRIKLKKVV